VKLSLNREEPKPQTNP